MLSHPNNIKLYKLYDLVRKAKDKGKLIFETPICSGDFQEVWELFYFPEGNLKRPQIAIIFCIANISEIIF